MAIVLVRILPTIMFVVTLKKWKTACMKINTNLRFRYSDKKGPDINTYNTEFLNNHLTYTFLLCNINLPIMSDTVDQL